MQFDLNYISLKKDYLDSTKLAIKNYEWLNDFKFSYLNSTNDNLNTLFTVKNKLNSNLTFNTNKCLNKTCITCQFKYSHNHIRINSFLLPVFSNSCCISKKLVYVSICIKCNILYVGQTGKSFSDRFKQHIYNIYNFIPITKNNTEVSLHFNKKKHNVLNDLKFLIFKDNIDNLEKRLSFETDLIHILINLNCKLMNAKLPSIFNIKNFCFS